MRNALPWLLIILSLASIRFAEAQQPKKIYQIGYLGGASPSAVLDRTEAFRQGLRELGYVERKNIAIEDRYAEGKPDRLSELAAELVRLKVDVTVTSGGAPTRSAKEATSTIPIVMAQVINLKTAKQIGVTIPPNVLARADRIIK